MEATDDGIEALEAVLAACCKEALERGPKVPDTVESAEDGDDEPELQHGKLRTTEGSR
jgi:hypothetical protein